MAAAKTPLPPGGCVDTQKRDAPSFGMGCRRTAERTVAWKSR